MAAVAPKIATIVIDRMKYRFTRAVPPHNRIAPGVIDSYRLNLPALIFRGKPNRLGPLIRCLTFTPPATNLPRKYFVHFCTKSHGGSFMAGEKDPQWGRTVTSGF